MTDPATPEPGTNPPPPAKAGHSATRWAWGIIVVVAATIGLCVWNGNHGASDQGPAAVNACEGFVKDRLKSPGSARFSGEDHTQAGSTYTVTGTVDAQNSFGALLRSSYTCVVRDDGSQWTLQSLTGL